MANINQENRDAKITITTIRKPALTGAGSRIPGGLQDNPGQTRNPPDNITPEGAVQAGGTGAVAERSHGGQSAGR